MSSMRTRTLATDYDGTLAENGLVAAETIAALERLKASGRRLVVVTGRQAADLVAAFPRVDLADRVVAENGATLYRPGTGGEVRLTRPVDERLVAALREQRVEPLSVGRCVVATSEANAATVVDAAKRLGLELEVGLNKGAAMALPHGVDKGTGLAAALDDLGLSPEETVGVGDAENDVAFLRLCGRSAAVANALATVQEGVDLELAAEDGAGVRELVELVLRS